MVALHPNVQNNTKYIHFKHWLMLGVTNAANSECAYLMTKAEMSKRVVHNYHTVYLYRRHADGNKYNWKYNTISLYDTIFTIFITTLYFLHMLGTIIALTEIS
jgi:hypothetical protein